MVEFKLPDIGEGLSEAELLEWTVKVGAAVKEGDEVAMISTDKVNVDLTSPATGVVAELFGEPGDIIAVGTLIMRIDNGSGEPAISPREKSAVNKQETTNTASDGHANATQTTVKVKAAPVVRRYAVKMGVDIARVPGTGPSGQVLRTDIDGMLATAEDTAPGATGIKRVKLSGPRLAAAQHLTQAGRTQVATTISFEVIADALLKNLQHLSVQAEAGAAKLTPVALIMRCLQKVLLKHPHFNATINEQANELLLHQNVDIGLAVDSSEGLLVPVIRGLEQMDVFAISTEIRHMAELARSGELKHEDLKGSTFTLSSTGGLEKAMITATTPIINYPNVATLWVSRINDRPRVADGKLGAGPILSCSLSFDHRYLHGADAMAFINDLGQAFKSPQ